MDFSLSQDSFTPIKPQRIEMLFSPCTKAINKTVNDTYRVSTDGGDPKIWPPKLNRKFPIQSTEIKPIKPNIIGEDKENGSIHATDASSGLLAQNHTFSRVDPRDTQYQPLNVIKSNQPTRATCFHPTGDAYIVGSNSQIMYVCRYPSEAEIQSFTNEDTPTKPEVLFTIHRTHLGSIYCASFNSAGDLLATGSNDRTLHLIHYDPSSHIPKDCEYKFEVHSGTVRDLCFTRDGQNPLLVSGGARDFEISVTDCQAMKHAQILKGHESTVMSLSSWNESNGLIVSGSHDGSVRLWDLRSRLCAATLGSSDKVPVNVVRVDPTGRLLVSGHQNGICMLHDIRGNRVIQSLTAHQDDIRTLNFSPKCYYLLTASYDGTIKLMDIQGNLTRRLPTVNIASLPDKVVQTAWHPLDYNFVTTCADGSATLWTMPSCQGNL